METVWSKSKALWRAFERDPRHYQIGVLSSLILIGVFQYAFQLPWWHVCACVGSTVGTQLFADKIVGRPFDARSPLISALSLTILLRTGSVWLSLAAGVLAIGSKYLIRYQGKHIFNPANFGLVIMALLFSGAWISPGQWGSAPIFAILLAGLGGAVTGKAKRWDVSLAFLGFYAGLVFARALWLGDPLSIPVHQLQSGALLIFTFFMISDPKTTPNARVGRVAYAALVASVGFTIQFGFYNSAGIILALVLTAPTVPLFDRVFRDALYQWPSYRMPSYQGPSIQGPSYQGPPSQSVSINKISARKADRFARNGDVNLLGFVPSQLSRIRAKMTQLLSRGAPVRPENNTDITPTLPRHLSGDNHETLTHPAE